MNKITYDPEAKSIYEELPIWTTRFQKKKWITEPRELEIQKPLNIDSRTRKAEQGGRTGGERCGLGKNPREIQLADNIGSTGGKNLKDKTYIVSRRRPNWGGIGAIGLLRHGQAKGGSWRRVEGGIKDS